MNETAMSDADYQKLGQTLSGLAGQGAMKLETLDGFFAALVAGPEVIRAAECLPQILGRAWDDDTAFPGPKAFDEFMRLVNGHWHEVSATLLAGEDYYPWLDADDAGRVSGNDWAEGFERGMALQPADWQLAFDNADAGAALAPIMTLAMEREADPALRTTVSDAQREELLGQLSPAVARLHDFFRALREKMAADLAAAEQEKTSF
ncbi:UPF0149 family protein [Crenobacter caeni]|uniref:UPF0149 family protein n=1 Tax=Crenobacter caeni TaxID=2705474 RepID=A0A6B2KPK2_9NEIS|nr:UPF0149 family protein [Crenobacter caeni]NDV12105.1 UPF0149 family protein [Crenobacter caeni]